MSNDNKEGVLYAYRVVAWHVDDGRIASFGVLPFVSGFLVELGADDEPWCTGFALIVLRAVHIVDHEIF